MGYKCVYTLSEIQEYLKNTGLFAFDFETSPRDKWRNDKSAALDAHKADITGISFQYLTEPLFMFHLNIVAGEMQRIRRQYGII